MLYFSQGGNGGFQRFRIRENPTKIFEILEILLKSWEFNKILKIPEIQRKSLKSRKYTSFIYEIHR